MENQSQFVFLAERVLRPHKRIAVLGFSSQQRYCPKRSPSFYSFRCLRVLGKSLGKTPAWCSADRAGVGGVMQLDRVTHPEVDGAPLALRLKKRRSFWWMDLDAWASRGGLYQQPHSAWLHMTKAHLILALGGMAIQAQVSKTNATFCGGCLL